MPPGRVAEGAGMSNTPAIPRLGYASAEPRL